MNEAEWQVSTDPVAMLRAARLRATDRKLRLFAAACCRLVWDALPLDVCRQAVLLGERYADDLAGPDELAAALRELYRQTAGERRHRARLAEASAVLVRGRLGHQAPRICRLARIGREQYHLPARHADLLRDLFGNLFRPATRPAGLRTPAVVFLAHAAHQDRQLPSGTLCPTRLIELADALVEVGCTDAGLLAHLREPRAHVRGCWVIDQLRACE